MIHPPFSSCHNFLTVGCHPVQSNFSLIPLMALKVSANMYSCLRIVCTSHIMRRMPHDDVANAMQLRGERHTMLWRTPHCSLTLLVV